MSEESSPLVKVGMVGSGFVAGMHSAAYRDVSRYDTAAPAFALQVVASRNAATAARLAAQDGWARSTTDWREVTRNPDLDLVAICTPEETHREIAVDAFDHGKHVFCEKPLATTSIDAAAMKAAADRSGCVQFVGLVLRFWPALEYARRRIVAGELGRVKNVRARYLLDSQTVLESSLRGLGSHVLDALAVLAGPVAAVAASIRPTVVDPGVDGRVAVLLEFVGGATGVVEVDREARGRPMDLVIEVDCEHGGVAISWHNRDAVTMHRARGDGDDAVGTTRVVLGPATSPYPIVPVDGIGFALPQLFTVQAACLGAAISGAEPHHPTFGDACHVAQVTDAIVAAGRTRLWQPVKP